MTRTLVRLAPLLATLTAACGDGGPPVADMAAAGPALVAPSTATQALLTKTSGYRAWPTFTENATPTASKSHKNMFVVTRHNDVVGQAIASKTLPLPDGAIIVKDNFAQAADTTPMAITIMSKEAGQWYWAQVTPDGKVFVDDAIDKGKPLEGRDVKMCTGCHAQQTGNDWVFVHDFTK